MDGFGRRFDRTPHPPRHDRPSTRLRARNPSRAPHPRHPHSGRPPRNPFRRSPTLRPPLHPHPTNTYNSQLTTYNFLHRPRQRTPHHLPRRFHRALPSAPHADQGRAAQPVAASRNRQHLRRRVALPRRHPSHSPARLTRAELARLRASLVKVLRHAIRLGGSSVSDYVDAEGARGFFQLQHRVYRRTGLPCLTCSTPIRRITLAGRSTHFCPHCQR